MGLNFDFVWMDIGGGGFFLSPVLLALLVL